MNSIHRPVSRGFITLLVLLIHACAPSQTSDIENRTRTFPRDFSATVRASVSYLQQMGWSIQRDDRQIGIIETNFINLADVHMILGATKQAKVTIWLTRVPLDNTKVIMEIRVTDERSPLDGIVLPYDRRGMDLYDELFDGLAKVLGVKR